MTALQRSIRRAHTRLLIVRLIEHSGRLTLVALAAAAAVLLGERLLALWTPEVSYGCYIALAAAVLPVSLLLAFLHRPSADRMAAALDHRLHLKDQLSTALYCDRTPALSDDPFARGVTAGAQQTAARLKVQTAFPLKPTPAWGWVPPVAAVVALLFAFLPLADVLGIQQQRQRQQEEQARAEQARDELVKAMASVQQLAEQNTLRQDGQTIDGLQELAEMTRRDLSTPQTRKEAAQALSELQQKLTEAGQKKDQELAPVQSAMSRLDAGQPGPADAFADALRRGDFAAAQAALEQLARDAHQLDDAQREALKQQLQNLANQLQSAADQAAQQQAQAQQAAQQALQNAGLSQQQIQQLQQQGMNPQAVQQALQQQGMNPQQAQQMAQQIQQMQQQAQQQGQCSQCSGGMAQGLQQMAQSMQGQQGQQGQPGQPGQQGQPGSQGVQQGAGQVGQQLSQLAQMQQQLQQMQASQQQLQQAMQQLAGGQPGQSGGAGSGQQPGVGLGGQGPMPNINQWNQQPGGQQANSGTGPGIGTGAGGNPIGPRQGYSGHGSEAVSNPGEGDGKVIAAWMTEGDANKNAATVEFNRAVTQARSDAEKAVTEDRVPRRYHQAIKDYFNQLPQSPDEVKSAPKAPR